ncbi:MAG: helix-turn-helix domain-containing protein [Micavibrio sp.]|nr:helix-turn-helix domain-containing protein [Micavibrio sp.]
MPRTREDNDAPHPVDIHVGAKVKNRRLMLGLSQEELAKSVGVTFQQVQKYERGTNRISVSRLAEISTALKTSIDYFLDGAISLVPGKKLAIKGFSDSKQESLQPDPMMSRDVIELVRAYQAITSPKLKKQALEILKTLAQNAINE